MRPFANAWEYGSPGKKRVSTKQMGNSQHLLSSAITAKKTLGKKKHGFIAKMKNTTHENSTYTLNTFRWTIPTGTDLILTCIIPGKRKGQLRPTYIVPVAVILCEVDLKPGCEGRAPHINRKKK